MEKRKSFILHFDSLEVLNELSKEQIADLFIAIKDYNLWKEVKLDWLMKAVFVPFKNQFDRDLKKYNKKCEVNAENIKKRWNKEDTKNTNGINGKKIIPKDTYNKNDNKKDKDKVKDKEKRNTETYGEFSNVYLTKEEIKKLENMYGIYAPYKMIEELSAYIEDVWDKYNNHYLTILNWMKRKKIMRLDITPWF